MALFQTGYEDSRYKISIVRYVTCWITFQDVLVYWSVPYELNKLLY